MRPPSRPGLSASATSRTGCAVNFGGTIAVLQLARRLEVRRVVVISSGAVYGSVGPEEGRIAAARTPPKPISLYSMAKLAAEQTALHPGTLMGSMCARCASDRVSTWDMPPGYATPCRPIGRSSKPRG